VLHNGFLELILRFIYFYASPSNLKPSTPQHLLITILLSSSTGSNILDSICKWENFICKWDNSLSVSGLLPLVQYPPGAQMLGKARLFTLKGWVVFCCGYVLHSLYQFIFPRTLSLIPYLDYCEWHCHEHGDADISWT
jgi:hypothetical protein